MDVTVTWNLTFEISQKGVAHFLCVTYFISPIEFNLLTFSE